MSTAEISIADLTEPLSEEELNDSRVLRVRALALVEAGEFSDPGTAEGFLRAISNRAGPVSGIVADYRKKFKALRKDAHELGGVRDEIVEAQHQLDCLSEAVAEAGKKVALERGWLAELQQLESDRTEQYATTIAGRPETAAATRIEWEKTLLAIAANKTRTVKIVERFEAELAAAEKRLAEANA